MLTMKLSKDLCLECSTCAMFFSSSLTVSIMALFLRRILSDKLMVAPPMGWRWYGMYPIYPGIGWGNWKLHKGLNMKLGASVFAQFGKHAHHRDDFLQNISVMYAIPITNNLSFAAGGYFNSTYWGHDTYRDAGLSAVLGYRFDDHWEAYLYGQKSLVGSIYIPYPLYDMNALGDRIGAAVKYNFNKNFSITLSIEKEWTDNSYPFNYHHKK